jgi:Na+/proline symporter
MPAANEFQGFELTTTDLSVMAAYLLIIIGIGFWVGRGKKEAGGFFLAE